MKKPLFKNTTIYNKKIYINFNNFHINKFGFKYDIYTLLLAILFLYCIVIIFKNKVYYLGFLFILGLISFIIWRLFRPIITFKKEVNSRKIVKHQKFTYCFYNYFFDILNDNKKSSLSYFRIRKIFETDNEFYLYLDKTHALLLDKSSFTIGTSEEFSKFIKKKCWYKYKKEDR